GRRLLLQHVGAVPPPPGGDLVGGQPPVPRAQPGRDLVGRQRVPGRVPGKAGTVLVPGTVLHPHRPQPVQQCPLAARVRCPMPARVHRPQVTGTRIVRAGGRTGPARRAPVRPGPRRSVRTRPPRPLHRGRPAAPAGRPPAAGRPAGTAPAGTRPRPVPRRRAPRRSRRGCRRRPPPVRCPRPRRPGGGAPPPPGPASARRW